MVESDIFKNKIRELIFQDCKVEFLGENFDGIVRELSDKRAEKIYEWIKSVIEKKIQPISIGSEKNYKNWQINELLVFRHPFTINNNEYRILFVKIKNSFYIEFHLGDHKYYDKVRKDLDLKKSSY